MYNMLVHHTHAQLTGSEGLHSTRTGSVQSKLQKVIDNESRKRDKAVHPKQTEALNGIQTRNRHVSKLFLFVCVWVWSLQETRALSDLEEKLRSSRQLLSSKEHELRELHSLLTEVCGYVD